MSDGGISAGEVVSIVEGRVRPLEAALRNVAGVVTAMGAKVQELEEEMANVEGAINAMHRSLEGELHRLRTGNEELVRIQENTRQITLEQFVATNANLAVANVSLHTLNSTSEGGFQALNVGIDRMAQALVQTEVIRLLHEAKEPTERVERFAEEIEQRFAKAVENVWFVRGQYDQLLATAMSEYEKKLHLIGEHIYRIYEEDFRTSAEVPLTEPVTRHVELPLSTDERKLAVRAEALENRFRLLGRDLIEPILSAHTDAEHVLASRFAMPSAEARPDERAVPVAVTVGEDGLRWVGRVAATPRRSGSSVPSRSELTPVSDDPLASAPALRRSVSRLLPKSVPLSGADLEAVVVALHRCADRGLVDLELIPGYEDYLSRFGLEVVADQEVSLP